MTKFKSTMPTYKEATKKELNEKCERCKWRREDHRFGMYCYDYSDQDTDYFYDGVQNTRKVFVPKGTKVVGDSFLGPIYETDIEQK